MPKKKSRKPIGKIKRSQSEGQNLKPGSKKNILNLQNIAALIVTIVCLFILYQNGGYKWVWDSLVMGNLKIIWDNPDLTQEKKWEIKCGFDYRYANYLKVNTPEDAVILMPPSEVLFPEGKKSDFNTKGSWGVKNKAWATYFVYPRKLVYDKEKEINPYHEKINFIAIANFWGYEKLEYSVSKKQKYLVLPVKKSKNSQ
jgi:hypothetical protein